MKRFTLFAVLVLLVGLCGCQQSDTAKSDKESTPHNQSEIATQNNTAAEEDSAAAYVGDWSGGDNNVDSVRLLPSGSAVIDISDGMGHGGKWELDGDYIYVFLDQPASIWNGNIHFYDVSAHSENVLVFEIENENRLILGGWYYDRLESTQ